MVNNYSLTAIASFLCFSFAFGNSSSNKTFSTEIIEKQAVSHIGNAAIRYVYDASLYKDQWDTLSQTIFWRQVIDLTQDSCILNVASNRKILGKMHFKTWTSQTEERKAQFKDSLRKAHQLPEEASIFVTSGKKEFYNYKKEIPSITKAIDAFSKENVNPWYAQVILLIESPGKLQKSNVGAYGPFQLMKSVAKRFGLVVNNQVDERADFNKSAMAAARLLGWVCTPEIKKILGAKNISYNENDLWFRLLVLHAYHAGSGNVSAVINKIDPTEGGMQLIRKIWQTEAGGFKNASQNYSQIGLASLIRFDKMVDQDRNFVFIAEGDRIFHHYKTAMFKGNDTLAFLSSSLIKYCDDLAHDLIPFQYFLNKTKSIEQEMEFLCAKIGLVGNDSKKKITAYLLSENQLDELGKTLLKTRRNVDAIELLKINLANNPKSVQAHESLATAYRISGQKEFAANFTKKAADLAAANGG
jgi:hypothetical protein